jgi:hypothetical protein
MVERLQRACVAESQFAGLDTALHI